MKNIFLIIFILLLAMQKNICAGEDINLTNEDGHRWNQYTQEIKVGYIQGYLISTIYSSVIIKTDLGNMKSDKDKVTVSSLDGFEKFTIAPLIPSNVSVGQLVDGLNAFYGDYKNQQILIPEAIYIVRVLALGADEKEIEPFIKLLRIPLRNRDEDFRKRWVIQVLKKGGVFVPGPISAEDIKSKDKDEE